ncbi:MULTISPECIES: BglG family transcription antiterminator [Mammaliicoccus]|uniref:BglG family transcription antiterminator n=2 Tax=Mammaliicoccus sciuri TaxID=1296 RepID=A0AB37HLC3_MAMSC|nr:MULTISPECIES: BglG family transcription antiterminator [Mammaliicoccus]MBN4912070.1 BglG family transcription antiterminator [Staphylococcus sp. EG-SA-13]ARB39474.1 PTS lactose transporter subunit IIB [Mammaliicoccus sciuri]MCD8798494.1 BglG family transcription antiterminator [Mammaliicoccus sciuri]MCE4981015.1 BglG family transcription antiterminator [Mammaliicoccus sciuri]MCE5057227.1 BglG family transcription antiterminator [Mammaliicoccus sciuri]
MMISNREKSILKLLSERLHSFLTIHDIAQALGISSRTVHREMKSVEDTLNKYHLSLTRVPKLGLRIEGEPEDIDNFVQSLTEQNTIDLSDEERKVIILYNLIQSKDPVKLYSLANEIGSSTHTLNKIIEQLEPELHTFELSLERRRGEGLILNGEEVNKRQLLARIMLEKLDGDSVYSVVEDHFVYHTLNETHLRGIVDIDRLFNVERLLMDELGTLPYTLTEASYLTLTIHIVLAIERIKQDGHVEIEDDILNELISTDEFKVSERLTNVLSDIYDVTFNHSEIAFITMHLRGARRRHETTYENNDIHKQRVTELIEFVKDQGFSFKDEDALFKGLNLHLEPAINRLEANIETYNPLTEMIETYDQELFEAVSSGLKIVFMNYHFPKSEVAYIALHFGGMLQAKQRRSLHVLVVCSSGIGTSRILSNRLKQHFSEITQTTEVSVSSLKSIDFSKYDGMISTVAVDTKYPHITVNPLLPKQDAENVKYFLKLQQSVVHDPQNTQNQEQPLSYEDYDRTVTFIEESLALIQNMIVEKKKVTQLERYLIQTLSKHRVIDNTHTFSEKLNSRMNLQGFALTGYPVAIPHLSDESIKKPQLIITELTKPLMLKTIENEQQEVNWLVCMFIPRNSEQGQLMSEVSSLITEHLDDIDQLLNDRVKIENTLKSFFLNKLKQKLTKTE